jgi:hypothetical protein
MRLRGWVSAAFLLVGTAGAQAAPPSLAALPSRGAALPIEKVVVFGQDARRLPQVFADEHGLEAAEVVRAHAASGLIQCGNAHGAGQLTLTDDVVTTAAHVFYDENGVPRAQSCNFVVSLNGRDIRVPIDIASIVAGSTNPYNVAPADDWAVARLVRPMAGIRPYGIAAAVHEDEPITFVARGHIDWGGAKALSMQECLLHNQISSGRSGTREFSFDCDTGDGASGGALMVDRDTTRIGAVLVGWRSNRPFNAMPFSRTHYNFAVTLDGAFRQAVYSAAGKMIVQK